MEAMKRKRVAHNERFTDNSTPTSIWDRPLALISHRARIELCDSNHHRRQEGGGVDGNMRRVSLSNEDLK